MIMPQPLIKIILLLNILVCLTQALLVKNQEAQISNNNNNSNSNNNNYQENSLEEVKFSSRSSTDVKAESGVNYNKVNDFSTRVLDNYDHRYPDGSYEFRYELSDGQARYERGYFIKVNNHKSLVVVGYYSYRMPNGKYITVFYNADQYGYRQNQAITRDNLPDLPRSIEIPESREILADDVDVTTTNLGYSSQVSSTTESSRI